MSNKIQIRRGLQANLPNPLDNGEFGWCSDSGNLYIGNGTLNENLKVAGKPITMPFSIYAATNALGGRALTTGATGLLKRAGKSTQTLVNKLVDGAANFDASYLDKTVRNSIDNTWAKITNIDSATQLTLSADIMALDKDYEIADALDNLPEAFSQVPGPFYADVTILMSPGTYTADVTFIGKTPSGNLSLTIQGDTAGGTTISGTVNCRQRIAWKNLKFTGRINTYYGADITWNSCQTQGASKLYCYMGSANLIQNSTVSVGNDPTNITSVNSTITKGYTLYAATSALGGDDSVADGLPVASGTATSTLANKLVDSSAGFTLSMLGKTIYNSTDDTWAKITSIDSATQAGLSANIMAVGETYTIVNAFSTVRSALNAVPSVINCDTDLKLSPEIFTEDVVIQGKSFSGPFRVKLKGTVSIIEAQTTATGGSAGVWNSAQGYVDNTNKNWTADQHKDKWAYFAPDTQTASLRGKFYLIDSNTSTRLTFISMIAASPLSGEKYTIVDFPTTIKSNLAPLNSSDTTGRFASLWITSGQTGFEFQGVTFDKTSGAWETLWMEANSQAIFHNCKLNNNIWFLSRQLGNATFNDCLLTNPGSNSRPLVSTGRGANTLYYHSKVRGQGLGVGYHTFDGASMMEWIGSIFENLYYTRISTNAIAKTTGNFSLEGATRVRNCTVGLQAQTGGQVNMAGTVIFSGCTTNVVADPASYGFIAQ
ncbi:MAG: hypothetical protein HYS21_13730 [Deltaproteobacteria bacterium]|nr:hypothetical protein [Deltaproteobacteria bacterium]